MTNIAVIIPFYQREKGILIRALTSVLDQKLPSGVSLKVIIIDDESPLSVDDELASFLVPSPHELVVLKQKNGGPGAARNAGLEAISDQKIDFIAFLDSDDVWKPAHLAQGLGAMGDEADFYFCDHLRWYDDESWFAASETIRAWFAAEQPPFFPVSDAMTQGRSVYEFKDDQAFLCLVSDYFAQTSSVIYRATLPARFDVSLRSAGEDNMFWLNLARTARKVRFTDAANIFCGEGVNMYFSSSSWDHPDAPRRLSDNLMFFIRIKTTFNLSEDEAKVVAAKISERTQVFSKVWLRQAVKRGALNLGILARLYRRYPPFLFDFARAGLRTVLRVKNA